MMLKSFALRAAAAVCALLFLAGCEGAAAAQKAASQPAAESVPQSAAPAAAGGKTLRVQNLQQMPGLPAGCEITAAAIALNYLGYEVSKETLARYLPRGEGFSVSGGKRYGPDPWKAFAGSPEQDRYGCYAPVVAGAVNAFLASVGAQDNNRAADLTGAPVERLYGYIDRGLPVVVWVTSRMEAPEPGDGWYLKDTGGYFRWIKKEHAMVLIGYTAAQAVFSDPNDPRGTVAYDKALFAQRYGELYSQAVTVE